MELHRHPLSRRGFLQASAVTVGAAALASVLPRSLLAQDATALQVTSPNPTPDSAATVLVGDVIDYRLRGDFAWNGGWVQFRLHEGRIDGEPIWYIRTDASDQTFATDEGLVFVPLLAVARSVDGGQTWSIVTVPTPVDPTGVDKQFFGIGPDVDNPAQDRISCLSSPIPVIHLTGAR